MGRSFTADTETEGQGEFPYKITDSFKINSDALQFLVQLFSSDKRGAEATCPLRVLHTLQAVPWDLQLFMVLSKAADLLQQLHEGGSLVMVLVPMICK